MPVKKKKKLMKNNTSHDLSLSLSLHVLYVGMIFFQYLSNLQNGCWIFSGQLNSPAGELHPILENQSRGIEKEGLMNNGRLEM